MAVIKGYLHYTQVKRPNTNFEPQWRVQVEVPKKTAQQFKKDYPANKNSVKEYTTEEFQEAFKVEPQAIKGEEHYVINIKQACYINGEPFGQPPRVFMAGDDGKLKDVTKKVEVGNGSQGRVQVRSVTPKSTGKASAKLANVVVDSLVEYEGGSGADLSELGDVDESSMEDVEMPSNTSGDKESSGDDDIDDDIPWDDDEAY